MKNILYLFLIATVFLCSCKGSSYMTQRYTHYSHGTKKANLQVTAAKADLKAGKNEVAAQTVVAPEDHPPLASANVAAEQSITKQTAANANQRVQLPKVKDLSRLVNFPSKQVAKANVEKQQASQAHRGLIFGLIDLALFIIIVAVIVMVVLLLLFLVI